MLAKVCNIPPPPPPFQTLLGPSKHGAYICRPPDLAKPDPFESRSVDGTQARLSAGLHLYRTASTYEEEVCVSQQEASAHTVA